MSLIGTIDLSALAPVSVENESIRTVAYKTVDVFAGLTKRKLWLKAGRGTPHTDGYCITVDFDAPTFYRDVEHELFHVLFGSDPHAKVKFVEDYTEKALGVAKQAGVEVNKAALTSFIDFMVGLLEDHRVNSLGGLLYPGSTAIIARQDREIAETALRDILRKPSARNHLALYSAIPLPITMLCAETGVEVPPPSARFTPIFNEGFRKVERRGFVATLIVAKWLMNNLVSEIVKEFERPPGQKKGGGQGTSDPGTRAQALAKLISELTGNLPGLEQKVNDVVKPNFQQQGAGARAAKLSVEALTTNVQDDATLEKELAKTEEAMAVIAAKARSQLRQQITEDEWLRKDAMAKVVFTDIRPSDTYAHEKHPDDDETVRRLRAVFMRIQGRRRAVMEDCGIEIDAEAAIARRITRDPMPCFRNTESGRGFRAIILIDRSGSMSGNKIAQAERACRVISRALKYPFVQLETWGFQSHDHGQVDITRYGQDVEHFAILKKSPDGVTPLHVAVRLAVRRLELSDETKHLFIITDGYPVYSRKDGRSFSTAQLLHFVRGEVRVARKHGIGVTGVVIGKDLPEAKLAFMFGPRKNWRIMEESRLGTGLVQLVSGSFTEYLRHA